MKSVELLTTRDAARMLRMSPHSVRMRVYRGQLPARKLGGRIVFIKEELERYIKNLPPAVREARRRNK